LADIDIEGVVITADALLTQREFARHLVEDRKAHYHFTAKGNQKGLLEEISLYFENKGKSDFSEPPAIDHGRIESRSIWTTAVLNDYLDFPYVGQVFAIERHVIHKKSGKESTELVFGLTSKTSEEASPEQVLKTNRGHWVIENSCHYILDHVYDEDRSQIRTGHGPENISRLRRFAVGLLKYKGVTNISKKIRQIAANTRMIFDYFRMTKKYGDEWG